MSIGNIGGNKNASHDKKTSHEGLNRGEKAHESAQHQRSASARKASKASNDVLGSLRKIGQSTKKVEDELGQINRHRPLNSVRVTLQRGFVTVKQSIGTCLAKVLHLIEGRLQAHLDRRDNRQMQKNIEEFNLFLQKFKARNPIANAESGSLNTSYTPSTVQYNPLNYGKSIEREIAKLSSQMNSLTVELEKAAENCAPSTSSSGSRPVDVMGRIQYLVTHPKQGRDISQELAAVKSAIKANQRKLAAFNAHAAKLLGTEKKAQNAARSNKVISNKKALKEALNKKLVELGKKNVSRLAAGSDRAKLLLQQRRDKLSSYAEKVHKKVELVQGNAQNPKQEIQRIARDKDLIEVARKKTLSKLESEIAAHKAQDRPDGLIQSWYHTQKGVDLEKKYSDSKSEFQTETNRKVDELHDVIAERNRARVKSNADFDGEQKVHLQFSKKMQMITDREMKKLSDKNLAELYSEGLKVAQRSQKSSGQRSAVQPARANAGDHRTLIIHKPNERSYNPQKVRKIVSKAFARALEDEQLANPEDKKGGGWLSALFQNKNGTRELLWGSKIQNKTFKSEVVRHIAGQLSLG